MTRNKKLPNTVCWTDSLSFQTTLRRAVLMMGVRTSSREGHLKPLVMQRYLAPQSHQHTPYFLSYPTPSSIHTQRHQASFFDLITCIQQALNRALRCFTVSSRVMLASALAAAWCTGVSGSNAQHDSIPRGWIKPCVHLRRGFMRSYAPRPMDTAGRGWSRFVSGIQAASG